MKPSPENVLVKEERADGSAIDRLRFVAVLCLVAAGAATFAVAFRSSLALWYRTALGATNVVDAITRLPGWMRVGLPILGATVAGLIVRLYATPVPGVSLATESVTSGKVQRPLRTTISRVLSSWAAIATGMSIGREGPVIEFGGSLGAALGRATGISPAMTRVLVTTGTAAGFAATYNTPFAAVLFVFEAVTGFALPAALIPTVTGTVIATMVTRAAVGAGPIYGQRSFGPESTMAMLSFAALGVVTAFAAFGFKRVLALLERGFERHLTRQPLRAAVGGGMVGLTALLLPEIVGNGFEPLNAILDQRMLTIGVAWLLVGKVFATAASIASGVPGGLFTPMLLVGAAVGSLWAQFVGLLPASIPPGAGSYALVGMAAATAANIHAPLTAAVLVFELSGDYAIVLPLLLATVVATTVSRSLGDESVYEVELRRKEPDRQLRLVMRQPKPPLD